MATRVEIERDVRIVLSQFCDPTNRANWPILSAALKPKEIDYDLVFEEELAAQIRIYSESIWESKKPPVIAPKRDQTILDITVHWSQEISGNLDIAGGYSRIAEQLKPNIPWVWFRFLAEGHEHGMSYDGLIQLEDHWSWFPKPWRAITPPSTSQSPFQHWSD